MIHLYIVDTCKGEKNNGLNTYIAQLGTFLREAQNVKLVYVWLNNSNIKTISYYKVRQEEHIYVSNEYSTFSPAISKELLQVLLEHTKDKDNLIFHFNWINHTSLAWQIKQHIVCKTILTKHCIPWRDTVTTNYKLFLTLNKCFEKKQNRQLHLC